MNKLNEVKLLALEIVNLIDNGDLSDFKTYGKIGDIIEKLQEYRLPIVKYLIDKEKINGK